ncbi:diguanylate cyclase [Bacterioplanoides sp.]|uniref:GGDEF domain-containing protein n=1 Tax=Bacterioplanoides sp. TaxID=2066072 RepID=UPI003B5AEE0D
MLAPAIPDNESERLQSLQALHMLDTQPEERFERITRLAKRLFNTPFAAVTLIDQDRQWFKSIQGIDIQETTRDISFCGHTILSQEAFIVNDAAADPRFADNPLVAGPPFVRFYAGFPITLPGGHRIGTLCILDQQARSFSADDIASLQDLAHIVQTEIASQQAAIIDDLTQIFNRRGFSLLGDKALANAQRYQWACSLVYFDLNKFKNINDQFGHAVGDEVLTNFCTLLNNNMRGSDIFARIGGDEFVALLLNTDKTQAKNKVKRIREVVAEYNQYNPEDVAIHFSSGVVEFTTGKHEHLSDLMAEGDRLMYQCKQNQDSDAL